MKREIKFRAWDTAQGSQGWTDGVTPIAAMFKEGPLGEVPIGFDDEDDRYILMQYIGLKDKTGRTFMKEI